MHTSLPQVVIGTTILEGPVCLSVPMNWLVFTVDVLSPGQIRKVGHLTTHRDDYF